MLPSFLVKINIKNENCVGFKAYFCMTVNNEDPIPILSSYCDMTFWKFFCKYGPNVSGTLNWV